MRRKKKHDHSHDVPHVDEKWLVSYSDMMTLLFGLFVMLYSFAMKNKSVADAVEKELKKVSEKGFQSADIKNASDKNMTMTSASPEAMSKIILSLNAEVTKLKVKLDKANENLEIQSLTLLKYKKDSDIANTKAKSLEKKLIVQNSRTLAGEASANAQLNVAADVGSALSPSVIVFARWKNRSHDIDMTVLTPVGVELNFKNRKISEIDSDEFVNDSDRGPGIEMFKTTAAKDGEYVFNISLYNSRGDESESKVEVFAVLNGKEKIIETLVLKDDDENRSKSIKLNLKSLALP